MFKKKKRLIVFILTIAALALTIALPLQAIGATRISVVCQQHPFSIALKHFIPEFEKETGIKVNFETLGQRVMYKKEEMELAGGTGAYDVMHFGAPVMRRWVAADWVFPISKIIADPDWTDATKLNLDDFFGLDVPTINGTLYSLPIYGEGVLLFYRKDVFSQAGITRVPDHWFELAQTAQKIQNLGGITPLTLRGLRGQGMNIYIWQVFLRSFGGSFFKDFPQDMTPALDSPEALYAADFYAYLHQQFGPEGSGGYDWNDVKTTFSQGKTAMIIDASMFAADFESSDMSEVVGKVGYAQILKGPAGRIGRRLIHGLMIPKASKNKEDAWEFIKWATSKDIQLKSALEYARAGVTRGSVMSDPGFMKKYGVEWAKAHKEAMEIGISRPLFEQWPEVGERAGIALQEITIGEKTSQQAFGEAVKDITDILRRTGFLK